MSRVLGVPFLELNEVLDIQVTPFYGEVVGGNQSVVKCVKNGVFLLRERSGALLNPIARTGMMPFDGSSTVVLRETRSKSDCVQSSILFPSGCGRRKARRL